MAAFRQGRLTTSQEEILLLGWVSIAKPKQDGCARFSRSRSLAAMDMHEG